MRLCSNNESGNPCERWVWGGAILSNILNLDCSIYINIYFQITTATDFCICKPEISCMAGSVKFYLSWCISVEFFSKVAVLRVNLISCYFIRPTVDSYPSQLLTSHSQKCSCDTTTSFTGFGVCLEIGFGAFFPFEYLVSG